MNHDIRKYILIYEDEEAGGEGGQDGQGRGMRGWAGSVPISRYELRDLVRPPPSLYRPRSC